MSEAGDPAAAAGPPRGPREIPAPGNEPLRLVHHHPGYLRIQANAFVASEEAGESPALAGARAAAEQTPGFRAWSHNPRTGSVVVCYEPGTVDADDLLEKLAVGAGSNGVENDVSHKLQRQELIATFLDAVQDVNRVAGQATGGKADLRELVPAALAATSVVSFLLNEDRGRIPTWDSLIYHGYRIFMNWHRPEVREREREGRKSDWEARVGSDNVS